MSGIRDEFTAGIPIGSKTADGRLLFGRMVAEVIDGRCKVRLFDENRRSVPIALLSERSIRVARRRIANVMRQGGGHRYVSAARKQLDGEIRRRQILDEHGDRLRRYHDSDRFEAVAVAIVLEAMAAAERNDHRRELYQEA